MREIGEIGSDTYLGAHVSVIALTIGGIGV